MTTCEPASLPGLRPRLLEAAESLLRDWARAGDLPAAQLYRDLVVALMRAVVTELARARGLGQPQGRLFAAELGTPETPRGEVLASAENVPVEVVGQLYETLLGYQLDATRTRLVASSGRKHSGSFYTPTALTKPVVEAALARLAGAPGSLRVCDPALGAGAFLLQAARALATRGAPLREVVTRNLYGVDSSALAVAVAEASLWLLVGEPDLDAAEVGRNLRHANSLVGLDPVMLAELGADEPLQQSTAQADAWIGAALEPLARERQKRHLAQARELLQRGSLPEAWRQRARAAHAFHWPLEFFEVFAAGGFDLVVGNPPWVAFAGRAAKPLPAELRSYYSASFEAWRGYPTLHGLFVERSARIAPQGTLALLVPSPIADLDGYRGVRRSTTRGHRLREPLLELGQDAFELVTQPCFVLVADPDASAEPSERPWTLSERQRAGTAAATVEVPEVLEQLLRAPPFPRELFGEMGFQTTSQVTRELLLRAEAPDTLHTYPLLEGRNVREFQVGAPRLFLNPDPERLARARCRLRRREDYQRVRFVVRQTATVPIAALHTGLPFRNSLLAGFAVEGFPPELMVGLLNSALYRALHLAARRDARQAAFPQVKIAHLRALPRPPQRTERLGRIAELCSELSSAGPTPERRATLDSAVFDLFDVPANQRDAVLALLRERVPRLGYGAA